MELEIIATNVFYINDTCVNIYLAKNNLSNQFYILDSKNIKKATIVGRMTLYYNFHFGYSLFDEKYKSCGIMTWAVKEVIKHTKFKKYVIQAYHKNKASCKVAQKCGFQLKKEKTKNSIDWYEYINNKE